jgi:hypothetical protein
MPSIPAQPWIPPAEPALARLAMVAADQEGLAELRSWPEIRGNGVVFAGLPPFLCWTGLEDGHRLVLLQARELGALVPGARKPALPDHWLRDLDLASLARPLRRHPCFPGGASVHVVCVPAAGEARVRGTGTLPEKLLGEVLGRLTGIPAWRILSEGGADL